MVADVRVFFVCYPDSGATIGGVKQMYRQVELLRGLGVEAYMLHQQPSFRARWFTSSAPVIDLESFKALPPDPLRDWLVLPETWAKVIPTYLLGFRKVVFNQNAYYTFGLAGEFNPSIVTAYQHADVRAVVTVSEDNRRLLQQALPLAPDCFHVVLNGIDPQLFHPPEVKHRRIAFLPRKNPQHAEAVQLLARQRPVLSAYSFHPLVGLPHPQLAQQLRESLLFLNFGHPEGFGLPLAEAIACGCVVVGYHGLAGRDFCREALYSVEVGDWLGCVDQLERAVQDFEADPQARTRQLLQQAEQHLDRYSLEREQQRCEQVWTAILSV